MRLALLLALATLMAPVQAAQCQARSGPRPGAGGAPVQVLLQGEDFRRWGTSAFDEAVARINARPACPG
jgi:hypothetical protein